MTPAKQKLTPAMRQFHYFKQKYPDSVLFFRMGDFYETFYKDAKTCSRVCGLMLTSRDKGKNPVPLAGVPYHAVDGYIKKMLQAGYKVAVCEQVGDPKRGKGPVERKVTRIVTPGTITDDILLSAKENNYLCAVGLGRDSESAVSWVDISTGHFFTQKLPEKQLLDELSRLSPAECLLPDCRGELFGVEIKRLGEKISELTDSVVTERPLWYFEPYRAQRELLKHFGTSTLEGFGIADSDKELVAPAGAVIEYLKETQKTALGHIISLKKIERHNSLQIDATTLRSLEVLRTIRSESQTDTLLSCLDKTLTPMGGRMLRNWLCMPLNDIGEIELRQDAVEELTLDAGRLDELRNQLDNIYDLERISARLSTLRAGPRDILALAVTLKKIPSLRKILESSSSDLHLALAKRCDSMDDLAGLLGIAVKPDCPSHLRDGGVIQDGFNEKLDELRSTARGGRQWLQEYQKSQIERTGIKNLKIGYNKVFGYYIEVSHISSQKVPADYVRKQTIKNAERYITDELKRHENKVLGAHEKRIELEQEIFEQLRASAVSYLRRIQSLAETVAVCDCISCLAFVARRRNYVRPVITDGCQLEIREGKHPVLAETLGAEFVSNDIELRPQDGAIVIITGPNMSGKSTYIRQNALLVLMAQVGSFIPAASAAIGMVDRIFTRVGASDELTKGQSTFMVEMAEVANIVNNATEKSLVILDEVGRGTSTYDGLAIAWAVTEYIANSIKARTLFATHYHELTELADILENVKNSNVAVREWMGEVVFLHKIVPGGTSRSYGIHVAKLAGVPKTVLERSEKILAELESNFASQASGERLCAHKTQKSNSDSLFVQKHKSALERVVGADIDNLTPIEAINLLNQIKNEIEGK